MSDDAWDADDFDPDKGFETAKAPVVSDDKWEGEDEEEPIKESWDDDEDEKADAEKTVAVAKKKKKSVKEKIAEKEEKRRLEREAKLKAMEAMTPEEKMAEKVRLQKLAEEEDLQIAKETFGLSDLGKTGIDAMHPVSKDDFDEFEKAVKEKFLQYEKSAFYVTFLENLLRDVTVGLDVEDVKKLSSTMNAISNEKTKAEKASKGKKKKKASSLNVGRGDIMDSIGAADDYVDEYDDFM